MVVDFKCDLVNLILASEISALNMTRVCHVLLQIFFPCCSFHSKVEFLSLQVSPGIIVPWHGVESL